MARLGLAFRCFFRVLAGKSVPAEALPEPELPKALPAPEPAPEPDDDGVGLQLLGLLQRGGRLIDFLEDEIDGADDDQIAAAARAIHGECQRVLRQHVDLARAVDGEEEEAFTVKTGFDPSRIRLIGNVTGEPPFTGTLRHAGWRATAVRLPELGDGVDPTVIAPAEVELA